MFAEYLVYGTSESQERPQEICRTSRNAVNLEFILQASDSVCNARVNATKAALSWRGDAGIVVGLIDPLSWTALCLPSAKHELNAFEEFPGWDSRLTFPPRQRARVHPQRGRKVFL